MDSEIGDKGTKERENDTDLEQKLPRPHAQSHDTTAELKYPLQSSEQPKNQTRLYPELNSEEQRKDARILYPESEPENRLQFQTEVYSESESGAKPRDQKSPDSETTPSENPRGSQLYTSDMPPGTATGLPRYKIFVIGKTGTGKSTLCNKIAGSRAFETGRSFRRVTTTTSEVSVLRPGYYVTVVDTSDISESKKSSRKNTVGEWKQSARGHSYMVVLTVRCDQRYSPAEYEVYRQIRDLWGRDLCRRLVVAFTFADTREDPSEDMTEELKEVWPELKDVMEDAGGRYVLFDNQADNLDNSTQTRLVEKFKELQPAETKLTPKISKQFKCLIGTFVVFPIAVALGFLIYILATMNVAGTFTYLMVL